MSYSVFANEFSAEKILEDQHSHGIFTLFTDVFVLSGQMQKINSSNNIQQNKKNRNKDVWKTENELEDIIGNKFHISFFGN